MAHSETDVLFGDVGIHIAGDQSEAELGISLSQNAQGLGLRYTAVTLVADWIFAQTPVMRILAITDAHNLPALRLLKRTAFQRTHDTSEIVDGTPLNERWFELRRNLHR